eukprot:1574625-Alexandrium_andersonii.AAC.1
MVGGIVAMKVEVGTVISLGSRAIVLETRTGRKATAMVGKGMDIKVVKGSKDMGKGKAPRVAVA